MFDDIEELITVANEDNEEVETETVFCDSCHEFVTASTYKEDGVEQSICQQCGMFCD